MEKWEYTGEGQGGEMKGEVIPNKIGKSVDMDILSDFNRTTMTRDILCRRDETL